MTDSQRPGAWYRASSIRARLVITFGVFILLLASMAAVGAWRLAALSDVTREMATVNLRMERVVGEWLSETRSNAVRAVVLTHTDDAELRRMLAPAMEATSKRINDLQKQVEGLVDTPQATRLFGEVGSRRGSYLASRKAVLDLKKAGDQAGATAMLQGTMLPAVDAYVGSIQALAEHTMQEVARDAANAAASARSGRELLLAVCAGGIALALFAGALITRSITRPLREAVATAQRVAEGDLTVRIRSEGRDEMAQLLQALEAMRERLGALVGDVADGARAVADTSAQIAQGNVDLSQRTEEQASTLEETASSMEEMTSTVAQNADHARQAKDVAVAASTVAREGGAAMAQVVRTMEGISAASRQIAEIIGVIDGIAFQTNILALNAAVEAARAGEQGRGFAVVATEVRSLAQRSAQAAREIKTLIAHSAVQVETGTREVDEAGRRIAAIVSSVEQVSGLVAEIAAATHEQSSGIGQVNIAMSQMDQVVQQNASLVEEATAATESMKQQAELLLRKVSRFRVAARQEDPATGARVGQVIPLREALARPAQGQPALAS